MTDLEVLRETRKLLTDPANWIKGENARDASGKRVDERDESAVCWCLEGALSRSNSQIVASMLWDLLRSELGCTVHIWNDDPATTHAEVLSLLDRLIAKLEAA